MLSTKEYIASLSIGKVLLSAWVFFTTIYFLLGLAAPYLLMKVEGNLINNAVNGQLQTVFQQGQENGQAVGYQAAIGQLGQALGTQLQGGCKEPVPVTFGSGVVVNVLSENCLQLFAESATAAQK